MLIHSTWDMRCRNLKLVNKTGTIVLAVPSRVNCTCRELGSWSDLWHLHSAWACKLQCTGRPRCVTYQTSLIMKDLNLSRNRWKWLIFQSRITNLLHVSTQSTHTQNTWEDRGNLDLWFSIHIQHIHAEERRRHYECYKWWKLLL